MAKANAESAFGILEFYAAEEARGNLTTEEAQKLAKNVIKELRYEGQKYFWINDNIISMDQHHKKLFQMSRL